MSACIMYCLYYETLVAALILIKIKIMIYVTKKSAKKTLTNFKSKSNMNEYFKE